MTNQTITQSIDNAYTDKLLMTLPNKRVVEVTISFVVNVHRAAVIIRGPGPVYLEIRASRAALLAVLTEGVKRFTVRTLAQVRAAADKLPEELARAETAWPWLVERFPWIFDGINTNTEPYATYLKSGGAAGADQYLAAVDHLGPGASLADISEAIYGERTYGGARYKTVKDVQTILNNTTTTPNNAAGAVVELKKAA